MFPSKIQKFIFKYWRPCDVSIVKDGEISQGPLGILCSYVYHIQRVDIKHSFNVCLVLANNVPKICFEGEHKLVEAVTQVW